MVKLLLLFCTRSKTFTRINQICLITYILILCSQSSRCFKKFIIWDIMLLALYEVIALTTSALSLLCKLSQKWKEEDQRLQLQI